MTRVLAPEPSETARLLVRFHGGDAEAMHHLLERHLPWLRAEVRRQLGPVLRQKADTEDFVQDAAVNVLRFSPRFVVADEHQFRALLARIVVNVVRHKYEWFTARRRRLAQERPLPTDSVLHLGGLECSGSTPSEHAARAEREALVRLGVELLDAAERDAIVLRDWEDLPFADVGRELGVSEDAARMRYARAVRRLSEIVAQL
ncbi:MAG TPA: sigma-70 family RNA polymerase sigma factor, partial [Planctomycetota bacterium]|nr:sigma-70 family RNA polymerase sigma factor [Planctomycetota bacterium]